MTRNVFAAVLLAAGLALWLAGLVLVAESSTLVGVVLMVGAGLFLFRLGIAYRRTDPNCPDDEASTWTALRDGFISFGP
jgi:hypothetical protein